MSLGDNYNTEKGTVTFEGSEITLKQAYQKVHNNEASSEDLPKYPIPGKGYVHADKAHEIICKREGVAPL
jgi:hypothetical protein